MSKMSFVTDMILDTFKRVLVRFKNAKFGLLFFINIFKIPDFLTDNRVNIFSKFKLIFSLLTAILYIISGIDLIPEIITGMFGFIDDIFVLVWSLGIVNEEIEKYKKILKDNLPKRMRYYQGMIDLNILEKGENYKNLKKSFVIFICTFDLFGLGRHVYTFENRCIEDLELPLGDDTTKIILNTKGTLDDVSPEMKKLLNYIDGEAPSDEFTEELEQAVKIVRENEKWRLDYMTLLMR